MYKHMLAQKGEMNIKKMQKNIILWRKIVDKRWILWQNRLKLGELICKQSLTFTFITTITATKKRLADFGNVIN